MKTLRERWQQYLRARRIARLREAIEEMSTTIEWAEACREEYAQLLHAERLSTYRAWAGWS